VNVTFLGPSRIVWPAGAPAQTGMLMDDSGLDAGRHNTGGFDKDAAASPRTSEAGRGIRLLAETSRDMAATDVATLCRGVL